MEKVNKSTEIKRLLADNKTAKEIALELKTNVAYVYKMKKIIQNKEKNIV